LVHLGARARVAANGRDVEGDKPVARRDDDVQRAGMVPDGDRVPVDLRAVNSALLGAAGSPGAAEDDLAIRLAQHRDEEVVPGAVARPLAEAGRIDERGSVPPPEERGEPPAREGGFSPEVASGGVSRSRAPASARP